jgi:hypothetical protein
MNAQELQGMNKKYCMMIWMELLCELYDNILIYKVLRFIRQLHIYLVTEAYISCEKFASVGPRHA